MAAAMKRLAQELGDLQKEKWVHIKPDERNIFCWEVGLWVVNPESVWHGAYFNAIMKFPSEYPIGPPTFRFTTRDIYHPNIYSDGNICISILHKPGDDAQSGEAANERWNALHGVDSVLRSILLLLDDPEIGSPANVDAGVMYRDHRATYNAKAKETVAKTQGGVPHGTRMPTTEELTPKPVKVVEDDADFWNMTDDDESFGGSDSDMDDFDDDDDDEDDKMSR